MTRTHGNACLVRHVLDLRFILTHTWDRYDTHKLSSNFWDSSQQNAQLRELAGDYCDCCFATEFGNNFSYSLANSLVLFSIDIDLCYSLVVCLKQQ